MEPDPKATNLFQRYRPEEPSKKVKAKHTRRCPACDKRIKVGDAWTRHLASKGHLAKSK